MANAFTASNGWRFGGGNQKSLLRVEGILVVDTAGGDTALDLPASLFGLVKVRGISSFVKSDNSKVYFGVADYSNASVMIGEVSSGAVIDIPVGTYRCTVEGEA